MRNLKCVVFLLAVAICGHSYALDTGGQSVKQPHVSSHPACPSQQFSEFLKAFSESKEIQMAFTSYPLKKQQLDLNTDLEPKPIIRNLGRHQVKFPVIPNEAERKSKSLVLRIDEIASKRAKLTILKNDTDYQISYFFSRNSCWKLESIEDWSL